MCQNRTKALEEPPIILYIWGIFGSSFHAVQLWFTETRPACVITDWEADSRFFPSYCAMSLKHRVGEIVSDVILQKEKS